MQTHLEVRGHAYNSTTKKRKANKKAVVTGEYTHVRKLDLALARGAARCTLEARSGMCLSVMKQAG